MARASDQVILVSSSDRTSGTRHGMRRTPSPRGQGSRKMAVAARTLQDDPAEILSFPAVEVDILSQLLDLLLKPADCHRSLLLLLLAPLPEASTRARVPPALLIRHTRGGLHINGELDSAGRSFERHHLIRVLATRRGDWNPDCAVPFLRLRKIC